MNNVTHYGGEKFRRLKGALEASKRSLSAQADMSLEQKAYDQVVDTYKSDTPDPETGFTFHVIKPEVSGQKFSIEEFSDGDSLRSLSGQDRIDAFRAIFYKERSIYSPLIKKIFCLSEIDILATTSLK